jgi:MbtH protein
MAGHHRRDSLITAAQISKGDKDKEMNSDEREDNTIYKVVVNHEEQYSIWPADRENALGWNDAGKSGMKEECLAYIKEVWTDMRPLSLRKKMEEAANQSGE